MTRHWEAPRIAYELAVEWAEKASELAVGSGGAYGWLVTGDPPMVGKAWHDLRTLERHDVLAALGAQARSAVWELRRNAGAPDDSAIVIDVGYYAARICERAKSTLLALTTPAGTDPWTMPGCTHCADLLATALIDIQIRAIQATGIADPAVVLRMLLNGPVLPNPREASDVSGN